jgi:uncharacterized protein
MKKLETKKIIILTIAAIIIALGLVLFIISLKKTIKKIYSPKTKAPKIAIVIDDCGYRKDNYSIFEEINLPFDVAILPNLPYSKETAQFARKSGKEIILHLPLEPTNEDKIRLEADTITTLMNSDKIREILLLDLKSVPFARGVSNHMGSKATADKRLMKVIFRELKKKRMFFLDSFVTDKTIVNELAKTLKLPVAQRTVFLDNNPDSDYILKQLILLANKAKQNGFAIGIGHERILTLKVLKDYLPKLKKIGFEFVYVSELVK